MSGLNVYFDPFSPTFFHIYCLKPGHPNENGARWEKTIPCTKKVHIFKWDLCLCFTKHNFVSLKCLSLKRELLCSLSLLLFLHLSLHPLKPSSVRFYDWQNPCQVVWVISFNCQDKTAHWNWSGRSSGVGRNTLGSPRMVLTVLKRSCSEPGKSLVF